MIAMGEGIKSLESGNYQAAAEAFSRVVDSDGEEKVRALVARAYCRLWLQDPYSAIDDLTTAKRLDAKTSECYYAELTARLFRDPRAITDDLLAEFFQRLSERLVADPHDLGLYLERARELAARGFETQAEKKRFSVLTLCDSTMAVVEGGEFRARALRTRADEWSAWGDLADDVEGHSRAADDIDQLRHEILYFSDYSRDHVLALLCAGRDEEAMDELNELITGCSSLFEWRALLYVKASEWKKALADLEDAFRLAQGKTGLWRTVGLAGIRWERAQIHFELQDYQAALSDLDVAVKEGGGHVRPFAYILRARLNQRTGDDEKALADLNAALDAHKDPLADTRTPIEQSMMSAPGDTFRQVFLARALFFADQGKFVEALTEAERGVSRWPEWAESHFVRAAVYHKMGETAKAEQDRNRAVELDTSIRSREYPERFELWSKGVPHG